MTFTEWLATVPEAITNDPLWRMKVYRLSLLLSDLAWRDVTRLVADRRTKGIADQLYRAVGSIGANIAEGYSRRSGKDRARLYEYALGSTREARHWYYQGRHVLPDRILQHRLQLLAEIARMLLSMIPEERTHYLAEEPAEYEVELSSLLDDLPLP
jgi:four helix bundle protein